MLVKSDHKKVDILATEICGAFTVQLRSDGILHSHTSSGIDFNIDSLKEFNLVMGKMVQNRMTPLLLTLDEFAIPPVETRVFWAKRESCTYASAEAYVSHTIGHTIIGNFYLKFNKPGRPTKIFKNEEDAVTWLKTFM